MLRHTSLSRMNGKKWGALNIRLCRRTLVCIVRPVSRLPPGAGFSGSGNSLRGRHPRCHISCAATGRTGSDPPQDWTQVVSWSRSEFLRCVSASSSSASPDGSLHLAKCCLLVALEEEAACSGEAPHPELQELMAAASGSLRPRSAASASTWSGERLEALAAEVAALLDQQLEDSVPYRAAAPPAPAPSSSGAAYAAGQGAQDGGPGNEAAGLKGRDGFGAVAATDESSASATAGAMAEPRSETHLEPSISSSSISAQVADSHSETAASETTAAAPENAASSSFDFAAEQEQLLDRIHTSKPGAVGSSSRGGSGSSSSWGSGSSGRSDTGRSAGGDDGGDGDGDGGEHRRYYGSAWPSGRRVYGRRQALYRRYPVQTLAAVNTVLFDRHGYQACNRYGVPSDYQLAAVMERGVGASAALSILYLEVCERLGFPLAARPLEDGRYFVLWPVDAPLTADGQRFLVDPYGRGGLLLLDEVCEIFGVDAAALRPASRRELLAALLGELRDAHWAAAAGCSPQPMNMTPLSVGTALENKVAVPATGVRAASLRRALAATEKRLWLLPDDSEAQLQYGLLLYFSRRYDDAWIELALYLERFASGGGGGGEPQRPSAEDAAQGSQAVTVAAATGAVRRGGTAEELEVHEAAAGLGFEVIREAKTEGVVEEAPSRGASLDVTIRGGAAGADGGAGPGDAGAAAEWLSRGAGWSAEEAPAAPAGSSSSRGTAASLAAQVAVLVERIRLELDFAPA